MELDFAQRMNREHLEPTGPDAALEGRIDSFELAFRMQADGARIAGHLRRDREARASSTGWTTGDDRRLRPAVPDGAAVRRDAACASCR